MLGADNIHLMEFYEERKQAKEILTIDWLCQAELYRALQVPNFMVIFVQLFPIMHGSTCKNSHY